MSTPQNFPKGRNYSINDYLPAVLKENKSGWIIEYYAKHPLTEILTRKQIKVNKIVSRYKRLKDAREHISRMIIFINSKLAGGWNPFFDTEDARLYEKITIVSELFLKEKQKELRENSFRSYKSFIFSLITWSTNNYPDLYCSLFNQNIAVRYIDDLYTKKNVGVTTYNNHIKMGRAFFNWAKEKCYTKQNPFEQIKLKPKPKKKRVIIPREIRQKITEELMQNNPNFLCILLLVYTGLIRPNEIRGIKIEHINLAERYIYIPAELAKNHKSRHVSITEEIITHLKKMNLFRYPKNYYLFGSDLSPAKISSGNRRYGKEWDKLRVRLKLPTEMQLYSLRDTGIFEMIKGGIDDLSVMQHADHSSLDMTTIYANHYDPKLREVIYTKAPKF